MAKNLNAHTKIVMLLTALRNKENEAEEENDDLPIPPGWS